MLLLHLLHLLLLAPITVFAEAVSGVGFAQISVRDPVGGGTMPGYVFYPTAVQTRGVAWRGPYAVHATLNANPMPGAKPLVVIAHGHGGSDLGHHDLAVYLASHRFVTATLEFPKDNFHDDSGNGRAEVMAGRPIQVSATISMLLDDPHWKHLISADRIGVAGFSAGGYASLLLLGGVPRFDRFIGYCNGHPEDASTCGLVKQLPTLAPGMSEKGYLEALQESLMRWGDPHDPRIRAAFVMAPQGIVFDEAGLKSVDGPVFLYYAEADEVLLPQENARHIAPLLVKLAGTRMVPKADHYVFLAPCSPKLAMDAPSVCNDPLGVDRTQVHAQINADALQFFSKTLGKSPR